MMQPKPLIGPSFKFLQYVIYVDVWILGMYVMYICMCVCMYVCMYTYMYNLVCIYIYPHIYTQHTQ